MQKITTLILLFLCLNALTNNDFSIVFIHTGRELPPYLKYAIQQARLFNKECPIFIVANQNALIQNPNKTEYTKNNVILIACEELKRTNAHIDFLNHYRYEADVWEGYWIKAVERFFYLEELITKYNLHHIFHLENDNTLYVDLNEILPVFKKNYQSIGAIFDAPNFGRPGFIYFSNKESITQYIHFISETSKKMPYKCALDMVALDLYRQNYGPTKIDSLPVIPKTYCELFEMKNLQGEKTDNKELFYNHIEEFKSIFDGGPIGIYLGGLSPQCQKPKPGEFWDHGCYFDVRKFTYEWIKDSQNRRIPYLVFEGEKIRINNLHIHSKNLDQFIN